MAKFYPEITGDIARFIARQHVFFVATAAKDARVNVSPKGLDSFRILSPNDAAYLDLTGSGNETAAHLKHDGRITLMFCSFGREAKIVRLFGKGRVVGRKDPAWADLIARFPDYPGVRQIVAIAVETAQTSCGYAAPQMIFLKDRQTLAKWAAKKGEDGLDAYRAEHNRQSIDGLEP